MVGSACLAGKAFESICKRILGEEVPLIDLDKKGIVDMLKNLFKGK